MRIWQLGGAFLLGAGVVSLGWWMTKGPAVDSGREDSFDEAQPAGIQPVSGGIWGEIMAANNALLHAPTPPARNVRLALPWEPSSAVVLGIEIFSVLKDPGYAKYYEALLGELLPHTDVLVMYHRKESPRIAKWIHSLELNSAISPFLERLELVPSEISSIWFRDFGPVFGWNGAGRLVLLDASYLNPGALVSNYLWVEAYRRGDALLKGRAENMAEIESTRGSDVAPGVLGSYLMATRDTPNLLVRPPLLLQGGDFIPVDPHGAIISQSTLEANGGRSDFLTAQFERYYGITNLEILAPLPGETTEHLDFILAAVGPDTLLVAAPPGFTDEDLQRTTRVLLKRDIVRRLKGNREVLERRFPKHRILEVPMPRPVFETGEETVQRLFEDLLEELAVEMGITGDAIWEDPEASGSGKSLNQDLVDRIREDTGESGEFANAVQKRILSHYAQRPIGELLKETPEEYLLYRTYLNSLQVVNAQGRELILIPRYRPQDEDEARLMPAMEEAVEAAYREARPQARIAWIDCSDLIMTYGAIRCMSGTLPAAPARR